MISIFTKPESLDLNRYFVVKYFLEAKTSLRHAAWDLAIGQSIGNPNNRSVWETDQMFVDHSCFVLSKEEDLLNIKEGEISVAFPLANLNLEEDGISQILCHIAGGQVDIEEIVRCQILDIKLPDNIENEFCLSPAYGIDGFRRFNKVIDKPFFGGIIKPKVGMSPEVLLEAVKEMVYGGVNFIKEDELLGNPSHCPLEERVPVITKWLNENAPNVIYCFCINGDSPYALERAKYVADHGGNGIHINVWSGLGVYRAIRKQNPDLWIHFQKSGDKFFTDKRAPFHIYWPVICKIAGWSGVDSIHAGMIGGYMNQDDQEIKDTLDVLWHYNIVPALSCGMHPGLVEYITESIHNVDWMANVGGAMHGHPMGTRAGGLAMKQAINGELEGEEYLCAIEKWGRRDFSKDLDYRLF
jgi:ribulose 1,5-bisphosphate carboxylase large subunit-like protein